MGPERFRLNPSKVGMKIIGGEGRAYHRVFMESLSLHKNPSYTDVLCGRVQIKCNFMRSKPDEFDLLWSISIARRSVEAVSGCLRPCKCGLICTNCKLIVRYKIISFDGAKTWNQLLDRMWEGPDLDVYYKEFVK